MSERTHQVLGMIVARGGSKSIPKKSIYPVAGKPLVYYTIRAAQQSRLISRLIISTDDPEMAEVARSYGVEVPFLRPAELAQDHTPDLPVFRHALSWLRDQEGYLPDAIVHLRPTTPLKSAEDIDRGIQLLLDHPEAESVRSVCLPDHTPFKMGTIGEDNVYRPIFTKEFPEVFEQFIEPFNQARQLLPKIWRHSGYVDVIRPSVILEKNRMSGDTILPLFFEEWRKVDIDSMEELKHAEHLIRTRPEFQAERGEELRDRLRSLKAAVFDGDGVLFTGRVFMHPRNGEVLKERSLVDGQGISFLRAAGIRVAFASGELGFLEALAAKLNDLPSVRSGSWPPIHVVSGQQGSGKVQAVGDWLARLGIGWSECAAMGDDFSDVRLLEEVGVSACPSNAQAMIRSQAQFIAEHAGGDGAIRDFANAILEAKGIDPRMLALR